MATAPRRALTLRRRPAETTRTGIEWRGTVVLLIVAVAAVLFLLSFDSTSALAATHDASTVLAQQSPYQFRDVSGGGGLTWPGPTALMANLPPWAQAAIVSALAVEMFFVMRGVARWTWRTVANRFSRGTE